MRPAQAALRWWLRPRARAFTRDLAAPGAAQARVLARIVAGLADTEYGRAHGVRAGDDLHGFRRRLPIVTYDDLVPWVERQMARRSAVLAPESVLFYERTSGSSGPVKHIPCTASLRRSFTELFLLWLHDLLTAGPPLDTARAWISTSPPAMPREQTSAGVPVGTTTDLDYLGGWSRRILSPFLALPPAVSRLEDPADYTYVAALFLFAGRPEVVSVWNPSLLTVLLEALASHRDTVARDVRDGRVVRAGTAFRVPAPRPDALAALACEPVEWPRALPSLRLVSCWADGPAAAGARHLRGRLPGVTIQGKGLLATEAPMTVPLVAAGGGVPLVSEVFFEFVDGGGAVGGLADLEVGQDYAVVITQKGGLARYRIGDRVRVTHRYLGTPCLAFEGREGAISDLVGEKLAESFVERALGRLSLDGCRFRSLVPVPANGAPGHYVLVVDRCAVATDDLPRRLDAELARAVRYAEARRLGQLGAARVRVVPEAAVRFIDGRAALGTRRGAVKPESLVLQSDLARRLLDA